MSVDITSTLELRLAATVGVTATTLHHYFENREAILRQVRLNAAEKLNRRTRGIEGDLPPHLFLAELGRRYLAFARENPNLYRLLFEIRFDETNKKEDHSTLYFTYLAVRGALERMDSKGKEMPDPRHRAMTGWL